MTRTAVKFVPVYQDQKRGRKGVHGEVHQRKTKDGEKDVGDTLIKIPSNGH